MNIKQTVLNDIFVLNPKKAAQRFGTPIYVDYFVKEWSVEPPKNESIDEKLRFIESLKSKILEVQAKNVKKNPGP